MNKIITKKDLDNQISFYDKESVYYTKKRYAPVTESYTQYIFKIRLAIFLSFLERIEKDLPKNATIFEIGCADGVVFKAIEKKFPERFSRFVGMDISPKMIEEAKKQNDNPRAIFCVRNDTPSEQFDIVIELGVHASDLQTESQYVSDHLKPGGYFFYSYAGSESIYRRIKLKDVAYAEEYQPYAAYESILRKFFEIRYEKVYGLFVPKLWKFPSIARALQPVIDVILERFVPELFHEKLYVLVKSGKVGL